jgi:hypothetical protein
MTVTLEIHIEDSSGIQDNAVRTITESYRPLILYSSR